MKLEPIDTLRLPTTPKLGDVVRFRPTGKTLDSVSYWNRWAWTSPWFNLDPEPKRFLIGKIKAIKREGDCFYYRIDSRLTGYDIAFSDVIGKHEY
jgi:hypothetical protein